jgi:hypothetical protein
MTITYHPAALAPAVTGNSPGPLETTQRSRARSGTEGHEIVAPPWNSVCMTDHEFSECDTPMRTYHSSNSNAHARRTNGF